MKIYIASSWRNEYQPDVVEMCLELGHEVYDFRNPPEHAGFGWEEVDPYWQDWSQEEYIAHLKHPLAEAGFKSDYSAMQWADIFILVLPSGRSSHLEMGWAIGRGKHTAIYMPEREEPELMNKLADYITDSQVDLMGWLGMASCE